MMTLTESILIDWTHALSHFLLWSSFRTLCLDEPWIITFNILIICFLTSAYLGNGLQQILIVNLKMLLKGAAAESLVLLLGQVMMLLSSKVVHLTSSFQRS